MNSEGFRETFLRNDREGPTKAEMAGRKEAKQKAGQRGQTEKNREGTECPAGVKNSSRRDDEERLRGHGNNSDRCKPGEPKMRKTPCAWECCTFPRVLDGRAI